MGTLSLKKKLGGFQLIAQEKLQAIICSIPGKKDLIIQTSLIKPLEHICSANWLKVKGVHRIFKLNDETKSTKSYNYTDQYTQVYILYSDIITFQRVINCIKLLYEKEWVTKLHNNDANSKCFHIVCVPSCLSYFHKVLEQHGLYGVVRLHHYNWDFILLDDNVLSLEIPKVFSSVFVKSDFSLLSSIAQSMRILQLLCGIPDYILTYGDRSENIRKIIHQLGPLSTSIVAPSQNKDKFNIWLIIDRDKDYASPLLTPTIYAGLLLEVFPYNAGTINLQLNEHSNKIVQQKLPLFLTPAQYLNDNENMRVDKMNETLGHKKNENNWELHMNALKDEIFAENRYRNFTAASKEIRMQVKLLSKELDNLNSMNLQEMHDYVCRKLPKVTELKSRLLCHLLASEKLIEMLAKYVREIQTLEKNIILNSRSTNTNISPSSRKSIIDDINKLLIIDPQRFNSFRLLCLFNVCLNLNSSELLNYVKKYCNYFGYRNLLIFHNLARVKLLPELDFQNFETLNIKIARMKILSTFKPVRNIASQFHQFTTTTYQANVNRYKLIPDKSKNVDPSILTQNENNNCFLKPQIVFNDIYIPLIAQFCTYFLNSKNIQEFIMKISQDDDDNNVSLNGKPLKFCTSQHLKKRNDDAYNDNEHEQSDVDSAKPNVFVYVLGGITYAEIAACHLIGKQFKSNIVVASDSILSGSDLIEQCFL